MNKKVKKYGIIAGCAALLVGGGTFAVKKLTSGRTVTVESVAGLNVGWYDDPFTSYGNVYDSDHTTVYVSDMETVTAVYVQEGQEVKAGDKLMAYDLSTLQFSVEIKKLQLQTIQNRIKQAEYELKKLKNTTPSSGYIPSPDPVPTPDPVPEPEPTPDPVPVKKEKIKVGDAWNYIDSIAQKYTEEEKEPEEIPEVTPEEEETPEVEPEENEETKEPAEEVEPSEEDPKPEEIPEDPENPEEPQDPEEPEEPEEPEKPAEGTKENPYRFIVQADGLVYGSLFNELKEQNAYAVIEIHEGNVQDGEEISMWWINSKYVADCEDQNVWYVLTHKPYEEEPVYEEPNEPEYPDYPVYDDPEGPAIDWNTGYTAEELARMITQKQRELKSLDLERRRQNIEIRSAEEALSDGVVYAKHDGVVTVALQPGETAEPGEPFLNVSGGTGVYIEGSVSELMLDKVEIGQTVYAFSWMSGQTYEGYVESISTYPTNSDYYGGNGNPNVSYYAFNAYFPDSDGLRTGEYLEMNFERAGGYNYESDDIYLFAAYIRKDANGYYVMKDDGTDHLIKQYVKVGKIFYSEYYQILEGLSMEDFIAFPYSKNAVEGAKTSGAEAGFNPDDEMWTEEGFYGDDIPEGDMEFEGEEMQEEGMMPEDMPQDMVLPEEDLPMETTEAEGE